MRIPGRDLTWGDFAGSLKSRWKEDKASDFAASVTYFGLLAVFPFLLFLVALASVAIPPAKAQALLDQLPRMVPGSATQLLGSQLRELSAGHDTGLLTIGAVGALWAAASGVVALMRALNTVHGVSETRPYWKIRLIAVALTVFTAIFSVVSALVMVAAGPVADAVGGPTRTLILWLRFPVAALLMICLWAVLYYVLPNTHHRFRFFSVGAIAGVAVWLAASWGFSLYVSHFGKYEATYGALGGVIVLLVWMYLSSSVMLLGAEMNHVLELRTQPGEANVPAPRHGRAGGERCAGSCQEPRSPGTLPAERPRRRGAPPPDARRRGWARAASAGLIAGLAGFLYLRRA